MNAALHDASHRFTVDEVNEMLRTGALTEGGPVELLNGRLVHMSPQSGHHSGTIAALLKLLLPHYGIDALLTQAPLHLDAMSEPEPDLFITTLSTEILHKAKRHATAEECLLVVEVALTSQYIDRKKARLYGVAGVPAYWLIDLSDDTLRVYSDPSPAGYGTVERRNLADGVSLPDRPIHLDLARLLV